jgi:hypothetical protein
MAVLLTATARPEAVTTVSLQATKRLAYLTCNQPNADTKEVIMCCLAMVTAYGAEGRGAVIE